MIVTSQHAGYRVITREENEKYYHAWSLSKTRCKRRKCPTKTDFEDQLAVEITIMKILSIGKSCSRFKWETN